MSDVDEHVNKLRLELRRGIVVLAVLSQMADATYGYHLIQKLTEQGLPIEEGTLYPLLRRLEKDGLLASEWDVSETRPRKYYKMSALGHQVLSLLRTEWFDMVAVMRGMLDGGEHE